MIIILMIYFRKICPNSKKVSCKKKIEIGLNCRKCNSTFKWNLSESRLQVSSFVEPFWRFLVVFCLWRTFGKSTEERIGWGCWGKLSERMPLPELVLESDVPVQHGCVAVHLPHRDHQGPRLTLVTQQWAAAWGALQSLQALQSSRYSW